MSATSLKTIVLMGVSGCGKSTIGKFIAGQTGMIFIEGNDHHPDVNIQKMSRGEPLTEADRGPWIESLAAAINAENTPVVVTCSALTTRIRRLLTLLVRSEVWFVHLHGDFELIRERIAIRNAHFMPEALLKSQFETLEPSPGIPKIDVSQSPEEIFRHIKQQIKWIQLLEKKK